VFKIDAKAPKRPYIQSSERKGMLIAEKVEEGLKSPLIEKRKFIYSYFSFSLYSDPRRGHPQGSAAAPDAYNIT